MKQNTRRARNKAVSNDTQEAAINWEGNFSPVHLEQSGSTPGVGLQYDRLQDA